MRHELDGVLRDQAKRENKSLNEVIIQILEGSFGSNPKKYRDLIFMIGTWVEDPEFDAVIADHDKIDEEMWR